jgi:hypothetical protein
MKLTEAELYELIVMKGALWMKDYNQYHENDRALNPACRWQESAYCDFERRLPPAPKAPAAEEG